LSRHRDHVRARHSPRQGADGSLVIP
jgi:hypothetical protein